MTRGIRAAAALFVFLIAWTLIAPACQSRSNTIGTEDSYDLRIGEFRGLVVVTPSAETGPTFKVRWPDGAESRALSHTEFKELFGAEVTNAVTLGQLNFFFRLFKISSWGKFVWIAAGLAGQGAFFLRMFVQWIVSERERKSVVPPIFWWFSVLGALLLTVYFAWRQDIVGILGQSPGLVVYTRNLRLIAKNRTTESTEAKVSPK